MFYIKFLIILLFCSKAYADDFELDELPMGKSITLPTPATTKVPLASKVRLTATDHRQTLKLSSMGVGQIHTFKVAIYDQNSEKVRYLNLHPGGSLVYTFKDLRPIQVVASKISSNDTGNSWLQIESNRPLTIAK